MFAISLSTVQWIINFINYYDSKINATACTCVGGCRQEAPVN